MKNSQLFLIENGILKEYAGPGGEVTVPDGVRRIGPAAFSNQSSLESVTLPAGVTGIGFAAFSNCPRLARVALPRGLREIGPHAFERCTSLAGLALPEGTLETGGSAFKDCRGLAWVSLPASLRSIGTGAFHGCESLAELRVDPQSPFFRLEDGLLIRREDGFLYRCPADKAGMAVLPAGVLGIRKDAFCGCRGLTGITLPASAVSLEPGAFRGCENLAEIRVEAGNPAFCVTGGRLMSRDGSVLYLWPAQKTGTAVIPAGVRRIEGYAFERSGLTGAILPDGLAGIGERAFAGCTELAGVSFPEGLASIEDAAFMGCEKLAGIRLPASLRELAQDAFYGCPVEPERP